MRKLQIFEKINEDESLDFDKVDRIYHLTECGEEFSSYADISSQRGDQLTPEKPDHYEDKEEKSEIYYNSEGEPTFSWWINDEGDKIIMKNHVTGKQRSVGGKGSVNSFATRMDKIVADWDM